tara:strand:- start:20018 stop:20374 length:357 start_codon:yes stop_codon:yes gene_type:complete
MKEVIKEWWSRRTDGRSKRRDKAAVSKRLRQVQAELALSEEVLTSERESRSNERDERIDRERMLKLQVRELEEQLSVNRITIENLTYETTRNRERLRAEVAAAVKDRKISLEGEASVQ